VKPSYGGPLAAAFAILLLAIGAGAYSYKVFANPASAWYAGKKPDTAVPAAPAGEPAAAPAPASGQPPAAGGIAATSPGAGPAGSPAAGGVTEQPVAAAVPAAPAAEAAPVTTATVPIAVPAEAPAAAVPAPEAKPAPEPVIEKWPAKIVERSVNPKGNSKVTVQGEPGKKLRSMAVDDLVLPVFYALPLDSGLKSLSSGGLSAVKSAIDKALQERKVEEKPEGVKMEFSADLAAIRKSLAARGFEVDKTWKLEVNLVRNVSYSSAADVLAAIRKAFDQKVPYLVDGEYRASEKRIAGDLNGLKITVDDVPYKVSVSGQKSESGTVKIDVATANP